MAKPYEDEFDWDALIADTLELSVDALGAWIRCLYKMRISPIYGELSMPLANYKTLFGTTVTQTSRIISELIARKVADTVTERPILSQKSHANVTLRNRRMYRVYKRQNADKQRQKRRREKIEADLSRKRHGAVTNSDSQSPLKSIKSLNKNTTKKRKEEDPRSKHPAIITVHEIMTIYPKKALWDRIIREIGEEPDKEFLRESFELWVSVNGNPMNLQKWLLGPNATGKLPEVYGEKSNGTGKQFTKRTDADVKRESEAFIQKKFGLA